MRERLELEAGVLCCANGIVDRTLMELEWECAQTTPEIHEQINAVERRMTDAEYDG